MDVSCSPIRGYRPFIRHASFPPRNVEPFFVTPDLPSDVVIILLGPSKVPCTLRSCSTSWKCAPMSELSNSFGGNQCAGGVSRSSVVTRGIGFGHGNPQSLHISPASERLKISIVCSGVGVTFEDCFAISLPPRPVSFRNQANGPPLARRGGPPANGGGHGRGSPRCEGAALRARPVRTSSAQDRLLRA